MKSPFSFPLLRTRKLTAVSLLALAAFTGRSYGQLTLGINFQGRTSDSVTSPAMGPLETAGATGANFANWNNVDNHTLGGTATSQSLNYSNGTASPITISYAANDEWNGPGANYSGQLNDNHLYYGIIKEQTVDTSLNFTINNLSSAGVTYDLFVYYLSNNASNDDGSANGRKMDLSLNNGAQIKYVRESTFTYGGSYIEGVSTNPVARDTFASNYAKFSGLSALDLDSNGTFELKLQAFNRATNDGIGIAGFSLVQYAAPTPLKTWNVVSGTWDTTTTNWVNSNNFASPYVDAPGDQVVFGNFNNTGARTVTIPTAVGPASVLVNNATGNDYTIDGVIKDSGFNSTFSKDGPGALTLTGANTFGGAFTLKHGTLNVVTIGDGANAGNLGKGNTLALGDTSGLSDTVLNYTGLTASVARDVTLAVTGATVSVPASQTLAFTSLTGSGSLTKTGAGTLAFGTSGGAGLTGNLNITNGTLQVAKLGVGTGTVALGNVGAAGFTYGGPALNDTRTLTVGANGGTVTVSNADSRYQVGATTTAVGALTVNGPGRLSLKGAVNFSAMPTVNAGATLAIQSESGNTLPAGPYTINGGTLELAPGSFTDGTAFNLTGGTLRLGHEGLQGSYYTGGYDQGALQTAMSRTYSTVTGYYANLGAPNLTARTTTGGQSDLNFDNVAGGAAAPFLNQGLTDTDNIRAVFKGKILITTAGLTGFSTRSDDGSSLFIDGIRVVDNNFFQGMTTRSGTINLTAGLHDILSFFYEGGGGAGLDVYYSPVGGTANQIIPNSVLFAADTFGAVNSNVNVTASSRLELTGAQTNLGILTQAPGTALTVAGSGNFASYNPAATGGSFEINVSDQLGVVNTGPITGTATRTLTKTGSGALLINNALPAGLSVASNGGIVVLQGSETGGVTTNPLGTSAITFGGGGLGFSATAGNPTYTTNLVAGTNSFRIEVGRYGTGAATSAIVWNPANGAVNVGSAATATFAVVDPGYTLNVTPALSGAGSVAVEEGTVNFDGALSPAGGLSVHAATVNVAGAVSTGALALTGVFNGVTGLNPTLNANSNLSAAGISVSRGTLNVAGTTTNTGAFIQNAGAVTLSGDSTHASVSLTGGNLNANGNFTSTGALSVTGGAASLRGANTTVASVTVNGTGDLTVGGNLTTPAGATITAGRSLSFDAGPGATSVYTGGTINLDNQAVIKASSGIADLSGSSIHILTGLVQSTSLNALGAVAINAVNLGVQSASADGINAVLKATPTFSTLLPNGTTGTNNGGIDFPNGTSDGIFNTFFSGGVNDAFTAYFMGTFTAKVAGSHTFRFTDNDDNASVIADTNFNGVFDSGDQLIERGCCGQDASISANLNVGQQMLVGYFLEDTGGGSGLKGYFNEPAGGALSASTIVRPGDAAQAGYWSYISNNGGGGKIAVAANSELRVKSFDGVTSLSLSDSATLRLPVKTLNATSTADTLALTDLFSQASVQIGDKNTLEAGRILLADGAILNIGKADGALTGGTLRINGTVAGIVGTASSEIGSGTLSIRDTRVIINTPLNGTGTVSVGSGATLGGIGIIAGSIDASAGAVIEPGDSGIGFLRAGSLTITGATLKLELLNQDSYDVLGILPGGTLGLANATLSAVVTGSTFNIGDVLYVINNQGTSPVTGLFNNIADNGTMNLGGVVFRISYDADFGVAFATGGNDVALQVVSVPEPASWLLFLGAGSLLLGCSRRRGSKLS